jgi:hypothetical protein
MKAKPGHFSRTLAKGPSEQQLGFGICMLMLTILIAIQVI